MRNCDGPTNPNPLVTEIGVIKRCPNAMDPNALAGFRAWAEYHRWKVLPCPGLDFYAHPNTIIEAIRVGEHEYAMQGASP